MTIFDAFPNAAETWEIGKVSYSTITGNTLSDSQEIHVVVDQGDSADTAPSPNAATIASDTLLYMKPSEAPETDPSTLVAEYAIIDPQGRLYAIIDAGIGKNQHTGQIEHIELKIRQRGINDGRSDGQL